VRRLKELDMDVVAIDHSNPLETRPFQSHSLDLCKKGALEPFIKPESVIYHLAGRADVGASIQNPRQDFEANLCLLFEVLESSRKVGCKIIYPSTASVYDPKNPLPFKEDSLKSPSSPYGAAKLAGEAYCSAFYRTYSLDVRIARLFSVYGPGMRRFLIYDLIKKLSRHPKNVTLLGDGRQIRDYLYIQDAVEGLIMIAKNGAPGEDYNLSNGQPIEIIELTKTIATLMEQENVDIRVTGNFPPGILTKFYADTLKIKSIGFVPKTSLLEGLQKTLHWLKEKN
jgi:UDP-glucose 4-epimerase